MKPLGGYMLLYTFILLYWEWLCHGYFNYFMMILRSTTGPYDRPIAEVAYGELLFSLYRGCMGVELGKSGWGVDMMSPMFDIPRSTLVWAHCISFLDFHTIITKYIYGFQTYTLYKRTLMVSDLVLARRGSKNGFQPPIFFKTYSIKPQTVFMSLWVLHDILLHFIIICVIHLKLLVS